MVESMGSEVAEFIKKFKDKTILCFGTCKKNQKMANFVGYPHSGGLRDRGHRKWWVYFECPDCKYQHSHAKMDWFLNRCVRCGRGSVASHYKAEGELIGLCKSCHKKEHSGTTEIWLVVFQGIPQMAFTSEISCEKYLVKEGTSMKMLDDEDHEGDLEYYNINLETE